MPKLRESPTVQQDRLFMALIEKHKVLTGITEDQELAERLGMDRKTFRYKKKSLNLFWGGELRMLFRILKFTEEEKAQVM